MEKTQSQKLFEMTPVLAFVIGYFLLHLFDWKEFTQLIWATWISLASFMVLAADLKMEHKGKANYRKLNFYSGLLTLIALVIFLQGFLHWYRVGHQYYRMALLVALLFIFFFVVFRAMRHLLEIKKIVEQIK